MAIFLNDVDEGGELVFPMADHKYSVSTPLQYSKLLTQEQTKI